MKNRRANPSLYVPTNKSDAIDALMAAVGIGFAASAGWIIGRVIVRLFAAWLS